MAAHPTAMVEAQFELWRGFLGLWETTARKMLGGEVEPVVSPKPGDKRFKDKDWQENQIFDFIKQSYLLTANWMQDTVARSKGSTTIRGSASASIRGSSPTRSRRPISS